MNISTFAKSNSSTNNVFFRTWNDAKLVLGGPFIYGCKTLADFENGPGKSTANHDRLKELLSILAELDVRVAENLLAPYLVEIRLQLGCERETIEGVIAAMTTEISKKTLRLAPVRRWFGITSNMAAMARRTATAQALVDLNLNTFTSRNRDAL